MARELDAPISPAPHGRARTWARAVLLVALLAQLLVPLTYYLRDDRYDERFAWRMFSGIRMQSCRVEASEIAGDGPRRIDLVRAIHAAWIEQIARKRTRVVDGFFERRCREAGVSQVALVHACVDADRRRLPLETTTFTCGTGTRRVEVAR